MAADRPHSEKRVLETKMGRSKFPGKPSKIGNRKRVNLSSCALPEDNDSSKAAENIYLGLSVFNETFGDNEMVAPGPFHGFSMVEVEEAMAEARLQQKEAELEHKNQGIKINLWGDFQSELFSIGSCCSYKTRETSGDSVKHNLCFDGGGSSLDKKVEGSSTEFKHERKQEQAAAQVNSTKQTEKQNVRRSSTNKLDKYSTAKLKLFKLSIGLTSKSLQTQAARRLLEKAKKANHIELHKNMVEKKFVLPSHSSHSSRVIKPNKRFLEEGDGRQKKLLRSHSKLLTSQTKEESKLTLKQKEETTPVKSGAFTCDRVKTSVLPQTSQAATPTSQPSTMGKVILREARLQLDSSNLSLTEGPFSSSTASSLSPNSHPLTVNTSQSCVPATVVCGVCGAVRFYRFAKQAKKFGIFSCESCRKFISKLIRKQKLDKKAVLECQVGKGLCTVPAVVRSPQWNVVKCAYNVRCEACWLKMCLKNFKMAPKMKYRLSKLLPANMRQSMWDDPSRLSAAAQVPNKFIVGDDNMKDFKWLHENGASLTSIKAPTAVKPPLKQSSQPTSRRLKTSRKISKNLRLSCDKGGSSKKKTLSRQLMQLKGPRVKHVCRSASAVLGQPLATFPIDTKITNDSCQDCDVAITSTEPDAESKKPSCEVVVIPEVIQDASQVSEKKPPASNVVAKNAVTSKPPGLLLQPRQQNTAVGKGRKRSGAGENTDSLANMISMDFWESYDPDEVWETGFGLIGSEEFSLRALCFLCGSAGQDRLLHCASCCEPYHEFCVDMSQPTVGSEWRFDWVCPRCTICVACSKSSGQQLRCLRCSNSYHTECVDRVGGRLLHSPDRPWVCSACLRCKSCNGVDVSVFVGNLPLCKPCFALRQKGNYCPLCQRCYEDDDYDSKMMECGQCQCWVHAKCEGLSDEKYQVLSFLPESVEFICRMCCSMPPAPWWIAVEAELKAGYLGVLKSLSKNRRACAMLKWSPRKQCTCRQVSAISRALEFDETKATRSKSVESPRQEEKECGDKEKDKPGPVLERKTSIEVINHPTETLKLTLKIMKPTEDDEVAVANAEPAAEQQQEGSVRNMCERFNIKQCTVRVKKCQVAETDGNAAASIPATDLPEDSGEDVLNKQSVSSPLNPPSDSGLGSTDDEQKTTCLTDEESGRTHKTPCTPPESKTDRKLSCDAPMFCFEGKRDCVCFLEVDTYNSRSKPFSPNLLSIKKKVTTSEYSSLLQFHQDMQRMIGTTQSEELMDLYNQTMKEIFPWFDPKFSRVFSNAQKHSGSFSAENTPVKSTPSKCSAREEQVCTVPVERLQNQPAEYFYSDYNVQDSRMCLLCKTVGDDAPGVCGRLLYCGQNEWVHCNCALWSGEVFEEIDGSLQNVHSAINRGRSIRCPECGLKGASIGCCAKNCQETYHFSCARLVGCVFMDDKTLYCPAHASESIGKLVQNEKEFEMRRPVYVELDKRKMKMAVSSQVRLSVGALYVHQLGHYVSSLSDQSDAIIPADFKCTRLFWSCVEPWRVVRYHFSVRYQDLEPDEGVDLGVNLTIDHSRHPSWVQSKLVQLKYFQDHHKLLEMKEDDIDPPVEEESTHKDKPDDQKWNTATPKRPKVDSKVVRRIFEAVECKEDESLSDNQNTADLLPPDIEEAIFKDLPHDILDGISMQDIFMEPFEGNEKDGKDDLAEDGPEVDEASCDSQHKSKKRNEFPTDIGGEFWLLPSDVKQVADGLEEMYKAARDLKRSKSDVIPNQPAKKPTTLRNHQRSCSLNWNCKLDGPTGKWKKTCKAHGKTNYDATVNLVEAQDRTNRLQELKFTETLLPVAIDSLKARLGQEEGKENKCLAWHTRMQPRLLQVDGGVDSSSGSEAGESPQRLMDEAGVQPRALPPPVPPYVASTSSPFLPHCSFTPGEDMLVPSFDASTLINSTMAVEASEALLESTRDWMKLSQCDGNVDTESEGGESPKHESFLDDLSLPLGGITDEEPVRCDQCHCTYRTKQSYQRHLEHCCNDYILSSSEGELSEEESSKKAVEEGAPDTLCTPTQSPTKPSDTLSPIRVKEVKIEQLSPRINEVSEPAKLEVKKAKPCSKPRTYTRRKPVALSGVGASRVQHMLLQQSPTPAVIVQDVQQGLLYEHAPTTLQYVLDSQSFAKPQLIATPNSLVSTPFQIQTAPEPMTILPQGVQMTPGLILQPSQAPPLVMAGEQMVLGSTPMFEVVRDPQTGSMYLTSHNQPVLYNMETIVSNTVMQTNQFVSNVLATSSFSQTSTQVYQASKLEQVVNQVNQVNHVNQVNQVNHVNQVNQVNHVNQVNQVNQVVPSNFIMLGPSSDKLMAANDIICLQQPGSLLQVPTQSLVLQPSSPYTHAVTACDPKIPAQVVPLRSIQPFGKTATLHAKPPMTATLVQKQLPLPVLRTPQPQQRFLYNTPPFQVRPVPVNQPVPKNPPMYGRNTMVARPSPVPLPRPARQYERTGTPKTKPRSRALVDYINNFRSDVCDTHCLPATSSAAVAPVVSTGRRSLGAAVSSPCLPQPVVVTVHSSVNSTRPLPSFTCTPRAVQPTSLSSLASLPTLPSMSISLPPSLPPSLSTSLPQSLTTSLPPSLSTSLPQSLTTALSQSLTTSLPHSLTTSLPHSLTTSLPPSLPTSLPYSLTTSLPPSLTTSLPPSLTTSLPPSLSTSLPTRSVPVTCSYSISYSSAPISAPSPQVLPITSKSTPSPVSRPILMTASSLPKTSVFMPTLPQGPSLPSLLPDPVNSTTISTTTSFAPQLSLPITTPSKVPHNSPLPVPFDTELKLSINMPSLDDSPPPSLTEPTQLHCDSILKKESPGVLLPLQDSVQVNGCPKGTPPKSPNEQKESPISLEENMKTKKKQDGSDQNCVTTKLVTIHSGKERAEKTFQVKVESKGPKLIFDVTSDDGFKSSSTSMIELFANICDSVQDMRAVFKIPPLPAPRGGHHVLGMQNHSLQHCLEQLRGVEQCVKYKCKYYVREREKSEDEVASENLSGCARTEAFAARKEHDLFAWLASRHRRLPKMSEGSEELSISNRRANSLPMAMRYRILRETSKTYVGVYRSKIHGKGLFCLREIDMGEMVIEYAGEVIRANLTDKREKLYTGKGIGCYMFRIDDHFVVDATMTGNAARFINHSCEPNCYSKVVDILGKKHIIIFALRRISTMEELTYDYKFPFEDEKISCHCASKKCRKYLN